MKVSITTILTIFGIALSSLSYAQHTTRKERPSFNAGKNPIYKDNGTVVDSLKAVYHCKSIEYANWDTDDACLTFGLLDSEYVPDMSHIGNIEKLKAVAGAVKKALKYPERYRAIYVIFIKSDTFMDSELRVLSDGAKFRMDEI